MKKSHTFQNLNVFVPEEGEFNSVYPRYFATTENEYREGVAGFGCVAYGEGSVYTGSLVVNCGVPEKLGFGEQNFLQSDIKAEDIGAERGLTLYKYVGQYDFRKTQWIYGSGVFYFVDAQGKPAAYCKGFFRGTARVGNYRGRTDGVLLKEFVGTREINLIPFRYRIEEETEKAERRRHSKAVLLGDSWFEFYARHEREDYSGTFYEDTQGLDVEDFGIGGSTYRDWCGFAPRILKNYSFEKAIINLGFNDLHADRTPRTVLADVKKFVAVLKELCPDAELVFNAGCHSPAFAGYYEKESAFNKLLERYCKENGFLFLACDKTLPKETFGFAFTDDGLHLNKKGYALWAPTFLKEIK